MAGARETAVEGPHRASARPTFSVVLETANLADEHACLRRALDSLAAQRPLLDEANDVVVLAERDEDHASRALLEGLPSARLVQSTDGSYASMKRDAAGCTTGDVVVFADVDCVYPPGWLGALLEPFGDRGVVAVTGETAVHIRGPYSLAVAATFNFPGFSDDREVAPALRYWANNVALRRSALHELGGMPEVGLGRGHCVLHAADLVQAGRRIVRQPRARALHDPIPSRDFLRRYFELGRDRALLISLGAARVPAFPPDRDGEAGGVRAFRRLRRAVGRRPTRALLLPLAIPLIAVAALLHTAGRLWPSALAPSNDIAR